MAAQISLQIERSPSRAAWTMTYMRLHLGTAAISSNSASILCCPVQCKLPQQTLRVVLPSA